MRPEQRSPPRSPRTRTWGERPWAIRSAVTAIVFVAGFVLASLAFNQAGGLVELGGLFQRATITLGWTWLALLGLHLLRGTTASLGR